MAGVGSAAKAGGPGEAGQVVHQWPLSRFRPYDRNPRKNDHAVERVAAAIREFGFKVPVLARSSGELIDGHLRLKAATFLGLESVPVLLADDLSDAQVRAFRISVNRMAELAEWDTELLAAELDELAQLDVPAELAGWTGAELEEFDVPAPAPAVLADPEDVPEAADLDSDSPLLAELRAPFPWFGGKRKAAAEVWRRFGLVQNYVEPFFGSGAVLLGRPEVVGNETINDLDGYVANFWRAVKAAPDAVAEWANNPVNENDLHARHVWLLQQRDTLRPRLEGDPDFCDPKIAGWWVWGISCWIGSGWCSGNGPWGTDENRQLIHLGNNGQGVNRQLIHLGDNGRGVNRKLIHLGDNGRGEALREWMRALATRLERVRVASGDWSRVCGPSVTFKHGLTGVFLDPPYADAAKRTADVYREDSLDVAHDVREWAIENGRNPLLRIALCGYEGEHKMPSDWSVYAWNAGSGFGGQATERTNNGKRERIWFSPACEKPIRGTETP